ncbi:Oxidase ustYa [Pseudocercospora fuligena]|uniref:Oxidase ustYa n=1 Tax=Pseudocercospora fuligena TaxID=685502 RepID=A0A8H6VQK7_9PEZI|nr:Oxidase ustYa [Pseudocercospora fuligena]
MIKYQKIPLGDEEWASNARTKLTGLSIDAITKKPLFFYFNIFLFTSSLLMIWTSTLSNKCNLQRPEDLLREVSTKSPMFDRIDMRLVEKQLNATLLPSPNDEMLRGEPSSTVDAAWDRIANTAPIALSRREIIAAGIDPSKIVKYPESYGLGEVYAARIDVFHQLHCLDALRRGSYWSHYEADQWVNVESSSPLHKAHLSHCIYYLAQNIMCQASVDIYPHVWTDTLLQPFPDFNRVKTCRDFDAVLAWQETNAQDEASFYKLRKPDGFGPPLHMSDNFKELWQDSPSYNTEADRHHGDQIG